MIFMIFIFDFQSLIHLMRLLILLKIKNNFKEIYQKINYYER